MIQLFITPESVKELTSISGTTDNDLIFPRIEDAQTIDIERVLGVDLYDKIYNDLNNNIPLTGEYLKIFDKYIVKMCVYFTAKYFILFNETKVSNIGNTLLSTERGQPSGKTIELSGEYESMAISVESNFRKYMEKSIIPEWNYCKKDEGTTNFNDFY